jgi:hypothetical protein
VLSVSPDNAGQGRIVIVTLQGTGFVSGFGAPTVSVAGAGVIAGEAAVIGSTMIRTTLVVASDAPTGAHNLTVTTSGGTSTPVTFTVNGPPLTPVVSALSATPSGVSQALAPLFGAGFTLTVHGQDFQSGAVVRWGDVNLATTFVSPVELRAEVADLALGTPGNRELRVTNPGGIVSNTVTVKAVERGDINGTRHINIGDALACALITGGINKPPLAVSVGDLNLNDIVNIGDCLAVALFAGRVYLNVAIPAVTGVSPGEAVPGNALTITGTGLAPGSSTRQGTRWCRSPPAATVSFAWPQRPRLPTASPSACPAAPSAGRFRSTAWTRLWGAPSSR